MKTVKLSNDLIYSVVLNWCKKNLNMYKDKYTIEILDYVNMGLNDDEVDLIYSHIEKGDAVEFVRDWYINNRGYSTGSDAQKVIAQQINEYFNVHFLKVSKFSKNVKVFNAILWHLGSITELAMPEDAIIETVINFKEGLIE